MYISGNIVTFQSRQHQLITGASDYALFQQEFGIYSGIMGVAWANKAQKEFASISGRLNLSSGPEPLPVFLFNAEEVATCFDTNPIVTISANYYNSGMNGYPNGNYVQIQAKATPEPEWVDGIMGNTLVGAASFNYEYNGADQGYDGTIDLRIRYNNGVVTGEWTTITDFAITC